MSITTKDVEHIANLARIELDPQEVKKFETELSGILQFIESLNELDTAHVTPVRGGTLVTNELRQDSVVDDTIEHKHAHLIKSIPEKHDGFVKVKAIFE